MLFTEVSAFFLMRSANSARVSIFVDFVVEFVLEDLRLLVAIESLLILVVGELILMINMTTTFNNFIISEQYERVPVKPY